MKSFSGSDQVEAELHFGASRVFTSIGLGTDMEGAIAAEDERWRAYAKRMQERVARSTRVKSGPYSGQSVIHHRWVSEEAFQWESVYIRQAVRAAQPYECKDTHSMCLVEIAAGRAT